LSSLGLAYGTLESERQSGDHKKDGIGNSGDSLIDFTYEIAKATAKRICGDYAASHLIRDQDHGA
jgi:hypothetical protein